MNDFRKLVQKNIKYYGENAVIKARDARYGVSPISLDRPIFVVGCSRAGTTLVYKTFSESKDLGSLHRESHDFWAALHPPEERDWNDHTIPENAATPADRDVATRFFYTRTGSMRIVDKNNQNGFSIAYLNRLFPDAHFVFIKRSPGDNINSLMHGWARPDEYGVWSEDLPETVSIDDGAYTRWCFFLADGWRDYTQSTLEDVCAFQYETINKAIYEAGKGIPQDQWHEIAYESLIQDPVSEFRRLFESVDLPFDSHMEAHCKEVIAKPYNAFSAIKIDKWKENKNSERIEKVLPKILGIAKDLGYAADLE